MIDSFLIAVALCATATALGVISHFATPPKQNVAQDLFSTDERKRHYISIAITKSRIEIHEQLEVDRRILQELVDDDWLYVLTDGVIVGTKKTNNISKLIKDSITSVLAS